MSVHYNMCNDDSDGEGEAQSVSGVKQVGVVMMNDTDQLE